MQLWILQYNLFISLYNNYDVFYFVCRSSRSDTPIVCYALASEDHAYCITEEMIQPSTSGKSPESSIDEEYEFGNNDK